MAAKLSGSGGGKYAVEANAEINVTPFVDVMLVLLIIFMVAAPMAAVNVKVELAPAVAKPSTAPPKPIYISIQPSGRIFIGDSPSDLSTLGSDMVHLLGAKRNPGKERIYIRADENVIYGDFMGVMNTLQDYQFYSVALVGKDDNKGGK